MTADMTTSETKSRGTPIAEHISKQIEESQSPIKRSKLFDHATGNKAALAAIEILIWQLVCSNTLPGDRLSDELRRYAHLNPDAKSALELLACIASAAEFRD